MYKKEFQIQNDVYFFELKESFPISCTLHDVPKSQSLFIIIPGVDGSHNGYMNKYISMANQIVNQTRSSVLRTSNPYISGVHWDLNFTRLMNYVKNEYQSMTNISIFAFSAGASIVAKLAYKYPEIKNIVLCSMARELAPKCIIEGLHTFKGTVSVFYGKDDHNSNLIEYLPKKANIKTRIFNNCDHFFSGKNLETFIKLPIYHVKKC